MLKCLATITVIVLLAAGSVASVAQEATPAVCTPSLGPANLDLTLKDLDGNDVRLSAYRGKILLINYWATWCIPCRVEMPALNDLYSRYQSRGVEVLGIAVDEPVPVLRPFVRALQVKYQVVVGRERHDALEAFGELAGVPATIVVNRDGTICQRHVGFTRKATFEEAIKGLL